VSSAQLPKVREFISRLLVEKDDPDGFDDQSLLFSSGRLDSLAAVQLVLMIEETFGITFEDRGFDLQLVDSIDAIAALLAGRPA
jgi:acyl carrier protein